MSVDAVVTDLIFRACEAMMCGVSSASIGAGSPSSFAEPWITNVYEFQFFVKPLFKGDLNEPVAYPPVPRDPYRYYH